MADALVTVTPLPAMQIVSLAAFRGRAEALSTLVHERWGTPLPDPLRYGESNHLGFLWMGPELWLVLAAPGRDLESELGEGLGALAAVVDQSAAYAGFEITGIDAHERLSKLVSLDLHPGVFQPGHAATTLAAHMTIRLWRGHAASSYRILVARSLVQSFARALHEAIG